MWLLFLVTLFVGVLCDPHNVIVPCAKEDGACQLSSGKAALTKILAGVAEVGLDPADPLPIDEINGDLSTLKYTFTDNTVLGLRNCQVELAKVDWGKSHVTATLDCPNIVVKGHYVINGRLIILPIEGKGDFTIKIKKYKLSFEIDTKEVQGKDFKYLMLKKYQTNAEAQEGMVFDFKNLFNGQKDLADAVHTFANQNWKEVADFVQAPVVNAIVKKLMAYTNKYLKTVPIEQLTL